MAQLRGDRTEQRATTLVRDAAIPTRRVPAAAPDEPFTALLERLGPAAGNRALVVDAGRVVGIVTASDITRLIDVRRLVMPGSAVEH